MDFAGSGNKGKEEGPPLQSSFDHPRAIALDEKSKTCFVADYQNNRIRVVKCE